MDIFSVFTLLGGLAFFLFGMNVMSTSLEKLAGGKLESALRKMTSNPFKSLLLGAGITIAIQSSSAMTVMLVGLVNSGIMELGQTVGVIMGADIGTTLTAWILSMAGIESDNVFVSLLKPENFSPLFALIGAIMLTFCQKNKQRDIGKILLGFAVLMYGMTMMKDAVEPLADMPEFKQLLVAFSNPVVSLLIGAVFTGIIQSSAASIGILQALALTGTISYRMAIPIIMGLNIGTCVTALLSAIGVNRGAKRVAIIHITIKIIGAIVWLSLFCIVTAIVDIPIIDEPASILGIAIIHSIFNLATIAMLTPFSKQLVKFANKVLPDKGENKDEKTVLLDERLLQTPSMALDVCQSVTHEMATLSHETMKLAIAELFQYDPVHAEEIMKNEDTIDKYEDKLNAYLVRISKRSLNTNDAETVSMLLHCIGNFERISDHAVNLLQSAQELHDKNLTFSDDAEKEMQVITDALTQTLTLAFDAFETNNIDLARKVEPMEEVVDTLNVELKNRHIKRLQSDKCTVELGYIFQDLLTNIERVSDHCSNIAGCMIETHENEDMHKYLHKIKADDATFQKEFHENLDRYYVSLNQ